MEYENTGKCCEGGKRFICQREGRKDGVGPIKDGLCIQMKTDMGGWFANISFCPFCGRFLNTKVDA